MPDASTSSHPRYPQKPMPWSIKQIREQIPAHLFIRDTPRAVRYAVRDIIMATGVMYLGSRIDPYLGGAVVRSLAAKSLGPYGIIATEALRWVGWLTYWWFQGLIFTGIWVIGHECGHGAFSDSRILCDAIGYVLHSLLFTPYFSWRISHHRHHSNHASMERDEVYVPKTAKDLGIPENATEYDFEEIFGDTPIYTLYMLIRQQLLAFPAYLLFNVSGQKHYPKGTNHFNPNSILFNPSQRNAVIMSNIGLILALSAVGSACATFGTLPVVKLYLVPWLAVTHWFIMITYLHHTNPALPHFRAGEWSYPRGAAATTDRSFLGWQGRFFLHDVAHFHVIHHFFPRMPWYHGEAATAHLRAAIGPYYAHSDAPVFRALWDTYNFCQYVDDEGQVLFYRNKQGKTIWDLVGPKKEDVRATVEPATKPTPSKARLRASI